MNCWICVLLLTSSLPNVSAQTHLKGRWQRTLLDQWSVWLACRQEPSSPSAPHWPVSTSKAPLQLAILTLKEVSSNSDNSRGWPRTSLLGLRDLLNSSGGSSLFLNHMWVPHCDSIKNEPKASQRSFQTVSETTPSILERGCNSVHCPSSPGA